jgi:hypothetical protein
MFVPGAASRWAGRQAARQVAKDDGRGQVDVAGAARIAVYALDYAGALSAAAFPPTIPSLTHYFILD